MGKESLSRFLRRGISRRNVVHTTMAAGAILGSGLWTPARADDDDDDQEGRCGQPLPITHTQGPGGWRIAIFLVQSTVRPSPPTL
jgi:hypothetical protein